LDESGIPAALRVYVVDGLIQRAPLKVRLSISDNFGRLPKEIELAMFRMVQEGLTNVLRHSGSDSAEIKITRNPRRVTLEIQDRGRGIPDEKLVAINEGASGVGIRGMRDRVRHLNGEANVYSNQSGTTVSITLPTYGINASSEDADDFSAVVQAS